MGMQTCADCKFSWVRAGEPCESCTGPNTDNSNFVRFAGAPDMRQRALSDADHARAFISELLSVCERFGVKMMYTDLDLTDTGARRINFASDKYTVSFQTAKRVSEAWRVSPISVKSEILALEIPMDEEDE